MNAREYEVKSEDGTYDLYFTNMLAENLWSQCDAKKGQQFNIKCEIIGHKTNRHAIWALEGTYMVNASSG